MTREIGGIALALSLSACGGSPSHTTEWFRQHAPERLAELQACDQLAISDRGAECANAQAAATLEAVSGAPVEVRNPFE